MSLTELLKNISARCRFMILLICVSGDAVTNTGDVHTAATVDGENLNQLPTDLNTLLAEIQQRSESQ